MKFKILTLLLFVSSISFAQRDNWVLMCDTIIGEQIYVETINTIDDCCYEWDGVNWVKRKNADGSPNCSNLKEGACYNPQTSCKKSRSLYTVIDNTGTNFANENKILITFTDGTTDTVTQPVITSGGWTGQLQNWSSIFSASLDRKCGDFISEVRWNHPTLAPRDGLLPPPSELDGLIPEMQYRYLQISACANCTVINKVELLAVNGVDLETPLLMTFAFKEGQEKRYDFCQKCGEEGTLYYQNTNIEVPEADQPICLFDCAENLPAIPASGCLFDLIDRCDNGVVDANGDFKLITVRYADCGDGQIISNIYETDATAALIEYELVGDIINCDDGEIAPEPQPDCDTVIISTETKYDIVTGQGSQLWTLLSKFETTELTTDFSGIIQVGDITGGTHPTGSDAGSSINGWNVFTICAATQPLNDGNLHYWISGSPDDYGTFTMTRLNADSECAATEGDSCIVIKEILTSNCGSITCEFKKKDENGVLQDYELQGTLSQSCGDKLTTTVLTIGCVSGVQIDVIIGYDESENIIFYQDKNGAIVVPDFSSDCPPLSCENRSETLCAGQDDTDLGITQGDELLVTFQDCNDGTSTILGAALLSNPTSTITLPTGFTFQACTNQTETELIGCTRDEDNIEWNIILINGTTVAYMDKVLNQYGTPNGDLTDCLENVDIVSAMEGKHCALIGGDTITVFLFLAKDKKICANPIGTTDYYTEGNYTLVSCCPTSALTETTHLAGFTVDRPTNTPNTGWNNEITTGSPALNGDFELCFTPTAETGNTPNMIGINSDPNTNASYTSIDHAVYFYNNGTTYLLRKYENGAFAGNIGNANWVGQEICFERIGTVLTIKQNGNTINTSTIGTGTLFLDDSHYFTTAGTWSVGSITYSDFVLRSGQPDENGILSLSECKACESQAVTESTCDCTGSNEIEYINGTNTVTLTGGTFCSYAITVDRNQVSVTEAGTTSPYPWTVGMSEGDSNQDGCKYLQNDVVITGINANSRARISIIR